MELLLDGCLVKGNSKGAVAYLTFISRQLYYPLAGQVYLFPDRFHRGHINLTQLRGFHVKPAKE